MECTYKVNMDEKNKHFCNLTPFCYKKNFDGGLLEEMWTTSDIDSKLIRKHKIVLKKADIMKIDLNLFEIRNTITV